MRKITLGLLALLMTAAATLSTAHRAEAYPVCPLCQIGHHCCLVNGSYDCYPSSNPCHT
jgi:hypothetical protein